LWDRFAALPDLRRGHGLRHRQHFVLACAAVSTLMGACGYRAFENTCKKLTQRQLRALGCLPDGDHGYGTEIEPPPTPTDEVQTAHSAVALANVGPVAMPQRQKAQNPYLNGSLTEGEPEKMAPPLAEGDAQTILKLCAEAGKADTQDRNRIVTRLYALDWDGCDQAGPH
jgi:hypothetical protein